SVVTQAVAWTRRAGNSTALFSNWTSHLSLCPPVFEALEINDNRQRQLLAGRALRRQPLMLLLLLAGRDGKTVVKSGPTFTASELDKKAGRPEDSNLTKNRQWKNGDMLEEEEKEENELFKTSSPKRKSVTLSKTRVTVEFGHLRRDRSCA
uniref:Histone-lysine N-methyltransferase SETMAR n=1 Tax=Macrostomum lignano TaxID=282301 RepID=A0A1I8JPY3_9PLAT